MRTHYWRWLTCWSGVALAVALMLSGTSRAAQTNAVSAKPEPVSNRYLIIIETSRGMMKRGDGLLETINSMIMSGMKGQMRGGDTLGMWTYNDKLHVGEFPLQNWTPGTRQNVARNAETFLKRQKFENKSRLSEVLPPLRDLIKESEFITVLILSSGREKISGTPFDQEINTAYATWAPEQEKKQMPVLTVLRATKGTITHQAVVPVPWTWEMPPLPDELVSAWNAAKKQVEALTNKPAAPIGQPLIVKGKKPEPVKDLPVVTPPLAVSNAPPIVATPATPATASGTNPPKAQSTPALAAPLKPAVTNQSPAAVPVARANPVTPVPSAPQARPGTNGETLRPKSPTPPTAPQVAAVQGNATTSPPPASALQLAQTTLKPAPDKPAARSQEQPTPEAPRKAVSAADSAATPPPGTLVPGPTIWENEWLWVGIGAVTLIGAIAGYSMIRRSQPSSRVSLITRSLDRTDKP